MLRREIWVDGSGRVFRYNLGYINHLIYAGDDSRVLGDDSANGCHHRHYRGKITAVRFESFEQIGSALPKSGIGWRRRVDVRKTEIQVEREDRFFDRGRRLARAADQGDAIPPSRVVAFEDVESLLHVLTAKRVLLLRQVNQTPASISVLAKKLNRVETR